MKKEALNEKQLAPIVLFCYNRPWHVEQTLDALSKNELADQSVLYIYCDGPKADATEEQKLKIAEVRQVIRKKQWCKEVHIVEAERNKGLKNNIVDAVTEICNQYGRVITLEDDVITSRGFLCYMNDALELYKDENRVMHISGYMWPHRGFLPETFFYEVPYPGGGWATWKRAWRFYTDDSVTLYNYWSTRWNEFNKFGDDYLQKQLVANYEGVLQTWFVKWHAVMLQRNALTLYPGKSLTNNIGFDNTATNCFESSRFDIYNLAERINVQYRPIKESWLGSQKIYAFYQGRWYNKRRRNRFFYKIYSFFLSLKSC